MAVTIKDVAALAGVSPSTVSRTCKNNPSISEETKERVRRAMAELGYEPNFQASNLAAQISRSIGIILPPSPKETYENSFYLETIRGISHYCNAHQYISTIVTGQNEEEILNAVRSMSRSGKVNGFIVLYSRVNDPVIDFLFSEGLLYILIGKPAQYTNHTIYIDNDNLLAGQEATEYLYALGHRKIAYLGVDNSLVFSADRKTGYMTALISHGLTVQPEYCIEVPAASQNEFQELRKLLLSEERPTAVLVSDDILALSLERICMEANISIPEDLSILSFNNSLFARLTSPQLTSIDINSGQLGMEAATQMISHIENPSLPATKIIVPHQLIERDSCRRISTWQHRFPAPSVSSCLRPQRRHTRIPFTLRRSGGSATTVTHISISAPLLPVRMKKRSLTQYVPCPEAVRLTDLLFFIPV